MNLASNNNPTHRFCNQPLRFTSVDLGIEPTKSVAKVAVEKSAPTLTEFLGAQSCHMVVHGRQQNTGETHAYSSNRR